MVIEIVDFPTENGGSFHSYGTVYQMVPIVPKFVPVEKTYPKDHPSINLGKL